jgi:carbamoyltransferase
MYILGITAPISWNNAAVLIKDGQLLAAAEEERFNRVKHAPRMPPVQSAKFCMDFAGIGLEQVDYIAVGWSHPLSYLYKNIKSELRELRWNSVHLQIGSAAEYFIQLSKLKTSFERLYPKVRGKKWVFIPHHISHAASACRVSGFKETNVLSLDGSGEDDSGGLYSFKNGKLENWRKIRITDSLGVLYSNATDVLGFMRHSHEGKTMGLAPYGKPTISLDEFFWLTDDWYKAAIRWPAKFQRRFGPPRDFNEPLAEKHHNLAASVQHRVEEIAVQMGKGLKKWSPLSNLSLAGGVTLNCDMNAKFLTAGIAEKIFIQPAAHDAGTALGAAMELNARLGGRTDFAMEHAYWGPEYSNDEIESALKESKGEYQYIENIESAAAKLLADGKILGWFQGRMEWGPRALGARSILAHPGLPGMKDKVNLEVKNREAWRPFAPSILEEEVSNYIENSHPSPFMLLTFIVKKEKRDALAAAMHIDNTARVQSVSAKTNPRYHKLIQEFQKLTNIAALLNTSFNDKGEPVVMSPKDALRTFFSTGLDALAMGNFLVQKPEQNS